MKENDFVSKMKATTQIYLPSIMCHIKEWYVLGLTQ